MLGDPSPFSERVDVHAGMRTRIGKSIVQDEHMHVWILQGTVVAPMPEIIDPGGVGKRKRAV